MKLEISPLEMLPHHLRATADFLNALAGGASKSGNTVVNVQVDGPKSVTGAAGNPPPPPPLVGDTANGADDTSSTESNSNATSQNGAIDTADLDKNGLPWDGRIHSGSRGKNQDGSWKQLRGVDKSIIPGIEAELRALLGNSPATGAMDAASTSTGSPAQGAGSNDTPPPPPPIADDTPPPPPVIEGAVDFGQVFQRVTALQKHADGNKLPQDLLNAALSTVGLATMADFMKNKDKAPELMAAINLLVGEE